MTAIIVAFVSGGLALVGTVVSVLAGMSRTEKNITQILQVGQAVQDEKISELTREVRRHNDFAIRIPQLETRVTALEKRMDREGR